jgi:hypothetical protein
VQIKLEPLDDEIKHILRRFILKSGQKVDSPIIVGDEKDWVIKQMEAGYIKMQKELEETK